MLKIEKFCLATWHFVFMFRDARLRRSMRAGRIFSMGGGQQWRNFILPTPKLGGKHFLLKS